MKIKSGFSLAEMLIALAIIAVISTMAFTISKKGTERAYNMYYYTGYTGITEAIAEAQNAGQILSNSDPINSDFIKYVAKLLTVNVNTDTSIEDNGSSYNINARNGIKYSFKRGYVPYTPTDEDGNSTGETQYLYQIDMTVPAVRQKKGDNATVALYYYPQQYGLLIPKAVDEAYIPPVDLQNRTDLLPFYFYNAKTGIRVEFSTNKVSDLSDSNVYEKTEYKSFKEIFCAKYGSATFDQLNLVSGCNSSQAEQNKAKRSVIRLANPRKIF